MQRSLIAVALTLSVILSSCGSDTTSDRAPDAPRGSAPPSARSVVEPTVVVARVVQTLPHDPTAFTQGLVVHEGAFLESTGQNGQSSLRRVNMLTGNVVRSTRLSDEYFGEGMTVLNGTAYVLTWLSQRALSFNASDLKETGQFVYMGEGWGLTTDGKVLYMSNGTSVITVRDPGDFHLLSTISVTRNGAPQSALNELEWIDGEIWANVWKTDEIVRIDPRTGVVNTIVDCSGIYPRADRTPQSDVLNGIAFDSTKKAIYVTGKNWPHVYQIELP